MSEGAATSAFLSAPRWQDAAAALAPLLLALVVAAVVLGFASELKIEWASLAYHGQHRRAAM